MPAISDTEQFKSVKRVLLSARLLSCEDHRTCGGWAVLSERNCLWMPFDFQDNAPEASCRPLVFQLVGSALRGCFQVLNEVSEWSTR